MHQITEHFSYDEFTRSETADKWGIDNTPPLEVMDAIINTCKGLERIRRLIGNNPIKILSGYRCKELNNIVGGSENSQHMKGEAADITCVPDINVVTLGMLIHHNIRLLDVDQLIVERIKGHEWVHVSFSYHPRHQTLTVTEKGTFPGVVV